LNARTCVPSARGIWTWVSAPSTLKLCQVAHWTGPPGAQGRDARARPPWLFDPTPGSFPWRLAVSRLWRSVVFLAARDLHWRTSKLVHHWEIVF
jgi:hypothetical protein